MLAALLLLPPVVMAILIALLSVCIGSFLNVVTYRLAVRHGFVEWLSNKPIPNIVWPRSFCPQCQHNLAWFDNIPLLSFLLLKGRCRYCHKAIAWQYPAVEITTLLLSLMLYFVLGLTPQLGAALLLTWWLIPMIVLDLKFFILPDELTLSLLGIALVINAFHIMVPWTSAVLGAVIGYLVLAILDRLYFWYRKRHGIGQGDWKLLAALGAFLGWQSILNIVTIAAVFGAICGLLLIAVRRAHLQSRLPFGVFLAIAAYIELLLDAVK